MSYTLTKMDDLNLALEAGKGRVVAFLAAGQPDEKLRKTIAAKVGEDLFLQRVQGLRDQCHQEAGDFAASVEIPT